MKLITRGSRIVAAATDEYVGPEPFVVAPEGFDTMRMDEYEVQNGALVQRVVVPQEVTMGQCRLALFDKYGIETDEAFLALTDMLPEDQRPRARLELRTRPTVRFDSPLVQGLCAAMGWNVAELFIYAAAQ